MLKWILILVGVVAFIVMAIFAAFAFMAWKHTYGFPKSILSNDLKGSCVISKQPFVLVKHTRGYISEKVFDFLPKPDGQTYTYGDYIPGTVSNQDGSEAYDLSEAVNIPTGTRFILKDGFQDRTINGSNFYFWLEPEGIELDSNFFHTPLGISLEPAEGGIEFHSDDAMADFPETQLFTKPCDEG